MACCCCPSKNTEISLKRSLERFKRSLKFAEALENTISVIAYAEYENVIEIDRNRNAIFDFTS